MPMHDWARVGAGTWHTFHFRWMAALLDRLNGGVLPDGLFAMAERRFQGIEEGVIALSLPGGGRPPGGG